MDAPSNSKPASTPANNSKPKDPDAITVIDPEPEFEIDYNQPSLEQMQKLAHVWGTDYITLKEIWAQHTKTIGMAIRFWATNFFFYKISVDNKGKISKQKGDQYKDLGECIKKEGEAEVMMFFLNHVCDLNCLNDLRMCNLDNCVSVAT